jgi:hypothetical protein
MYFTGVFCEIDTAIVARLNSIVLLRNLMRGI